MFPRFALAGHGPALPRVAPIGPGLLGK